MQPELGGTARTGGLGQKAWSITPFWLRFPGDFGPLGLGWRVASRGLVAGPRARPRKRGYRGVQTPHPYSARGCHPAQQNGVSLLALPCDPGSSIQGLSLARIGSLSLAAGPMLPHSSTSEQEKSRRRSSQRWAPGTRRESTPRPHACRPLSAPLKNSAPPTHARRRKRPRAITNGDYRQEGRRAPHPEVCRVPRPAQVKVQLSDLLLEQTVLGRV